MRPLRGVWRLAKSKSLSFWPKYTYCGCLPFSTLSTIVERLVSMVTCSACAICIEAVSSIAKIKLFFILFSYYIFLLQIYEEKVKSEG